MIQVMKALNDYDETVRLYSKIFSFASSNMRRSSY